MARTAEELAADDLARSGISIEAAEAAGIFAVDDASVINEKFKELPALVLPYFDAPSGNPITYGETENFCRVRYLDAPSSARGFGKSKFRKYDQPRGSGVQIYFPRVKDLDWASVFKDVEVPLVITEGEKKSMAGCLAGVPAIGLGGVSSFMRGDDLHPDLAAIDMGGRSVFIVFDSDADGNSNIQAAEGRLAMELSLKRGADVFMGRLPKLKGQDKTGIDDYILSEGADAFIAFLETAPPMRRIDSAVLGLNKSIAWIEREGLVYDMQTAEFIRKADFVKGSRHSALKVLVPTQKGSGIKQLSVAEEWLTHPHALRYQEALFKPDTDDEIVKTSHGAPALNLWRGWKPEEGPVKPFLELSNFLFSELPEDQRELPMKLIAYKAQNPGIKVPLALVLLGSQGCGKSLWARIVREAFAPYSAAIPSGALISPFNGWVEKSLVAVIDEAQSVHLLRANDVLKNLITDQRQNLNEKYRPARQVDSFTFYILTSNDRRVGSYSSDDRRMVVISAPSKREDSFYDEIGQWRDTGGPRSFLHWLLNYDLRGWCPPKTAPLTAEKYMAYMENLSPIQRLAEEMKTADHNVVRAWVDAALAWAKLAEVSDDRGASAQAQDIKNAMSRMQIRPFYTPEELAMMFPAIVDSLHGYRSAATPAGEISRQLRECGINYLRCKDDPRGFKCKGLIRQYLIIAGHEQWRDELTQAEFDDYMKRFPTYGEIAG